MTPRTLEPPVFTKAYDFVLKLFPQTLEFPRVYRPSLGARIQETSVSLLAALARARFGHDRARELSRADAHLAVLKTMVRLGKDLRCVAPKRYLEMAARMEELGRMIGGWSKSDRERGEPTG